MNEVKRESPNCSPTHLYINEVKKFYHFLKLPILPRELREPLKKLLNIIKQKSLAHNPKLELLTFVLSNTRHYTLESSKLIHQRAFSGITKRICKEPSLREEIGGLLLSIGSFIAAMTAPLSAPLIVGAALFGLTGFSMFTRNEILRRNHLKQEMEAIEKIKKRFY